jgi:hypothetical protein
MSTRFITKVTQTADIENFPQDAGISVYNGVPFMRSEAGLFALTGAPIGTAIYLDPANGADTNDGLTPATAKATLDGTSGAFSVATAGKNDTIYVIGDGATTGTVRVDAAFDWSKAATHLVGISSGVNLSNRSRIAPTASTTAFAAFFTVSASGCLFKNIQWFHGFNTGTTSAICLTVTGGRNLFIDCHIAGMGDAASAQNAGSRSLKISGTGENQFVSCTIGLDSIARTAANASVEFASATPRNQFIGCTFPFWGSAATPLGYIGSAAGCLDRFTVFNGCLFVNGAQSGSTTLSGLGTLPASAGGLLLMKDCTLVGITEFGTDATTRGQVYVDGAAPTAATSGIAVNPT